MKLPATIAVLLIMLLGTACGDGLSEAQQHHDRGLELLEQGRWREAIEEYDKAIELDAGFALAYFYRGNAYEGLRDSQQAIADYRTALSLTSDPYFAAVIETRIENLEIPEGMRAQ